VAVSGAIKINQLPKAIYKTLSLPSRATGINLLSKITTVIPLICAPALLVGLTASQTLNKKLNNGQQDPLLETLAKIYPVAYSAMMLCGTLNGVSYASFGRIFAYGFLFLGSIYNAINEYQVLARKKQLAELEALLKTSLDDSTKDKIDAQADQVYAKIAANTGNLAFFSRCFFPLGIIFTFFPNITQQSREFNCPEAKGVTIREFKEDFKDKFYENMRREFQAGIHYTRHELFSGKNWKKIFDIFSERDAEFKADLDRREIKGFNRFIEKFKFPGFNRSFILINMYLRFVTAIGTMAAVSMLGGSEFFNQGNQYENSDIRDGAENKPVMKWLFDLFSTLNNIGLLAMGLSSIFIGLSPIYKEQRGAIPSMLQLTGGSLVIGSAAFDCMKQYIPGAAAKFGSNACFQLANVFGTFKTAMDGLTAQAMSK
jgi:hypothetical protein